MPSKQPPPQSPKWKQHQGKKECVWEEWEARRSVYIYEKKRLLNERTKLKECVVAAAAAAAAPTAAAAAAA